MLTPDEIHWLSDHPEARRALHTLQLSDKTMFAEGTELRREFGDYARALTEVETALRSARGRRPLDAKLSAQCLDSWIVDRESVQQATPWIVATRRAARITQVFAHAPVHDVTCSIGTESQALCQAGAPVIASDVDAARVAMARHNLGDGALVAQADALGMVSRAQVVIADPGRRSQGRRILSMSDTQPPLPDLIAAAYGREMVLKCAPGMDYSQWEGEAEVVSVAGAVKEVALWSPGFVDGHVSRRATVIDADGGVEVFTDHDPVCGDDYGVGSFIVEPDGAIVRAGLVQQAAARWGMRLLDEHLAYVTGDCRPSGVPACEVLEEVSVKQVAAAAAAYKPKSVEVLIRGVDQDPDVVRKKIMGKVKGGAGQGQLTVVIARVGAGARSKATAFICGPRVVAE